MDMGSYLQFVFALIFVLGLIVLLTVAVRKSGFMPSATFRKGGQRRLKILEYAQLDAKHKLVLVRRDETEHLILLGAATNLLVESGIQASQKQEEFAKLVETSAKEEPTP